MEKFEFQFPMEKGDKEPFSIDLEVVNEFEKRKEQYVNSTKRTTKKGKRKKAVKKK